MKAIIERIWGNPNNGSWSSQSRIAKLEDGIINVNGVEIDPEGVHWLNITRDDGQFRLSPISRFSRKAAVSRFGQKAIDAHFPTTMTKIPLVKELVLCGPDPTVFLNDIIGASAFTGGSKRPPQQLEIGFEWQRLLIFR